MWNNWPGYIIVLLHNKQERPCFYFCWLSTEQITFTCVHTHTCMYVCTHTHTHTHTHSSAHTLTLTLIHYSLTINFVMNSITLCSLLGTSKKKKLKKLGKGIHNHRYHPYLQPKFISQPCSMSTSQQLSHLHQVHNYLLQVLQHNTCNN